MVNAHLPKMALWRNFHPMGMDVLTIPMKLIVCHKMAQIEAIELPIMEWVDEWTVNAF